MRTPLISGIVIALLLTVSPAVQAQFAVGVSVTIAPPPLPVYTQPPIPDSGFIWVPGYWAWSDDGYYWVPGTWVEPPEVGLLWTPGWWGWDQGTFVFHEGYWGPQVGFYGGINYGYGYSGNGYYGGYWRDRQFYYNRSVTNVSNTNITNVYNRTVINTTTDNNVSFNGGESGNNAQPTSEQRAAASARHAGPTAEQFRHVQLAAQNREQHVSVNAGKPPVAATQKPAAFSGREVVAARAAGGPVHTAREQQPNPPAGNAQALQQQRQQEQRGAQAEQQQRAQADQQQRAQADQQRRAQADQQRRAQADQQRRAQADQQQRAQAEQPPRNIREAQAPPEKAPPEKRGANKPPTEEDRSKPKKAPDENPR